MTRRRRFGSLLLALCLASSTVPLAAQEVPRDTYLAHVPLGMPRLVPESAASRDLALFGDPSAAGYRDVDPRDGIDDARGRVLMALALRFAPFLVQNTDNVPVNFETFIANRDTFPLWIDTWDVSGVAPVRVRTEGVNLAALGGAACDPAHRDHAFAADALPTSRADVEDCKLLALIERYVPGAGKTQPLEVSQVRQRPSLFPVLFIDFPGDGETTWKGTYEAEFERTPVERRGSFSNALVHPFILAVPPAGGGPGGYELVLQYWFFYPTNDSGMNHEGDWEHINVVISPRSRVTSPLSAAMVHDILSGALPATDDADDPLVIRRIDFYLHNLVMPLDFSSPNVYQDRRGWTEDVRAREQGRFRERVIWRQLRDLAYADDAETILNTHPFIYVGADNKGLNQALEKPGPRNRDSHASYPFPGRYPGVGPGGTTEQVGHAVDHRKVLRRLAAGAGAHAPVFAAGQVMSLVDPDRLRLVPDWERLVDLARTDSAVRRDWAWLLLPIRWGYPATRSPFSGILEHYNTGNVSPVGPAYNATWNVSGTAPGCGSYDPHALPDLLPVQLQDGFRNDLGFLNLTVPLLFNLPPLDFASRLANYPLRAVLGNRSTVYYPSQSLPFRFIGVSSGVSVQSLNDNYKSMVLNPAHFDQFVGGIILHLLLNGGDSTTVATAVTDRLTSSVQPFFNVSFYLGSKFVSENAVRKVRSDVALRAEFNNIPPFTYDATLEMWEYAGGLRFTPLARRLQPYVRAGYGWAWYRLRDVSLDGAPLSPPTIDWIKPRSILPNAWHVGLGAEFVLRHGKAAGWSGIDLSVRAEYGHYRQSLDVDFSGIPLSNLGLVFPTLADVPGRSATRHDVLLGVTISF